MAKKHHDWFVWPKDKQTNKRGCGKISTRMETIVLKSPSVKIFFAKTKNVAICGVARKLKHIFYGVQRSLKSKYSTALGAAYLTIKLFYLNMIANLRIETKKTKGILSMPNSEKKCGTWEKDGIELFQGDIVTYYYKSKLGEKLSIKAVVTIANPEDVPKDFVPIKIIETHRTLKNHFCVPIKKVSRR